MMSPAKLSDLEPRGVALMKADTYFSDITVMEMTDGDVATIIAQRLAVAGVSKDNPDLKPGLAIIFGTPGGELGSSQPRKISLSPRLVAAVLENPIINRSPSGSNKRALAVVQEVIRVLHRAPINEGVTAADASYRFVCPKNAYDFLTPDVKAALYGIDGGVGYHVNFDATIIVPSSNQ